MSTMSSCFADERASIPGRDPAILRNRGCRIQVFREQPTISNAGLLLVKVKGKKVVFRSGNLDVEPSFCTGFYEHGAMFLCFGFSFVSGHFPGYIQ